jgi:hypothetical protein
LDLLGFDAPAQPAKKPAADAGFGFAAQPRATSAARAAFANPPPAAQQPPAQRPPAQGKPADDLWNLF